MKLETLLRAAPRPAFLGAATAALAGAALLAGGEAGGAAARGLAVVALLGAAAAALRARRRAPTARAAVRLEERHLLARDCGVAVVAVGGRRLLVGYGAHGVQLLTELPAGGSEAAP